MQMPDSNELVNKAAKKLSQAKIPDTNIFYGIAKPGPYVTPLSMIDESRFQKWVKDNDVPWQDSPTADYDMRGFWKAAKEGKASTVISPFDGRVHYPDIWKTPFHKSFSVDSQYATENAPHWVGNDAAGYALQDKLGNILVDERLPNHDLINKVINMFMYGSLLTNNQ